MMAAFFVLINVAFAGLLPAAQDESKILQEQAKRFWDARVNGDWATVYDYLPEEEREGKTRDQYVEQVKQSGLWRYLHYKINAVETADNTGWIKIEYAAEPARFPGVKPKLVDRWEHWEKVDGKWTAVAGKRIQQFPQLPPSLRPLKEEKAVKARAEELWKAREKSDYKTVYNLCAPSFRAKVPAEQWLAKKALNLYISHQILWVEVHGEEAVARIAYGYRPNDPNVSKMDPLEETAMQSWIKVDGQWYLNVSTD